MSFWSDEGFLTHPFHTVVIDRSGRLAANVLGNQFAATQLGDLVQTVLGKEQALESSTQEKIGQARPENSRTPAPGLRPRQLRTFSLGAGYQTRQCSRSY
jgi:hypothetical protein